MTGNPSGVYARGQAADGLFAQDWSAPLYVLSGVKLRWLLDNIPEVKQAHESKNLCFGDSRYSPSVRSDGRSEERRSLPHRYHECISDYAHEHRYTAMG